MRCGHAIFIDTNRHHQILLLYVRYILVKLVFTIDTYPPAGNENTGKTRSHFRTRISIFQFSVAGAKQIKIPPRAYANDFPRDKIPAIIHALDFSFFPEQWSIKSPKMLILSRHHRSQIVWAQGTFYIHPQLLRRRQQPQGLSRQDSQHPRQHGAP